MLHRFFSFFKAEPARCSLHPAARRAAGRRLVLFIRAGSCTAVPPAVTQWLPCTTPSVPAGAILPTMRCRRVYINAVICTEDEHFMTHKGIDLGAIARALLADLRTHSLAEGGSTPDPAACQERAVHAGQASGPQGCRDACCFLILKKTYSKQQIFEMYANTIYFGSGYYGIAEAAEGYFGKEPAQLTDAEADLSGGYAQRAFHLRQQPGACLQADAGGAQADGQVPRVLTQQQADAIAADAESLTV